MILTNHSGSPPPCRQKTGLGIPVHGGTQPGLFRDRATARSRLTTLDGGSTLAVDPVVSKSLLRRAALDRIQELLHQLDRKWEYERRVLFGCDLGKSL